MEKSRADSIITAYMPKIYGFALSKTKDSREAEELSSDIIYEVYLSLLKAEDLYAPAAYIWRISSYVFARYTQKKQRARARGHSIEELEEAVNATGGVLPDALIDHHDPARHMAEMEERAEHEAALKRMRREIAYLGETQRKILVAHYYGGQTVGEISASLGIPTGTVKWHLHDARKTIKEGMNMERTRGKLGIDPIRLCDMGHGGCPGTTGDTSTHLATALAQNIAYAAYDEPKTEAEIAEELGVSPVYLAEFIRDLEEYGFMTRQGGGRLRTDVVIHRPTKEFDEFVHESCLQAADEIGVRFMARIMENIDTYMDTHRDSLYIPDDDRNLWRWNAFMQGLTRVSDSLMGEVDAETVAAVDQFRYKRPDGGDYTAFASLESNYELSFEPNRYHLCGAMTRGAEPNDNGAHIHSLQYSTRFDTRPSGWADNHSMDYVYLYEYISGQLPENAPNAEKYKRLYDRGLIVRRDGRISVNVPVMAEGLPPIDLLVGIDRKAFADVLRRQNERISEAEVLLYPPHMQNYIRAIRQAYFNNGNLIYYYDWMLENGYLSMPAEDRRGGIMTMVTVSPMPSSLR